MFANRPIIGIVGGIGSGKSYIADLFAPLGALVLKSDDHVSEAYRRPEVLDAIRQWWGDAALTPDGAANRKAIAARVFSDPEARRRLERLIHPLVGQIRDQLMRSAAANPAIRAFIWDIPLLCEVGLHRYCDAIVFVDAPLSTRQQRVQNTRGWEPAELLRRENSQLPLDKKREMAQYIIYNTADAADVRRQVEAVFSRILTQTPNAEPFPGEHVVPK